MRALGRRGIVGAVAVGAIAIAAACGSDDSNGDGISAEEWRAEVDAICARYDPQFDAIAEPTSADSVQPFLVELLELGREQTAEIEAVEVPDELADVDERSRENNREAVAVLENGIQRIDDGEDVGEVVDDVARESARIEAENEALAEEAGLEVCGADDSDDPGTTTTDAPPEDDVLTSPGDPATTSTPDDADTSTSGSAAGQYLLDVASATASLNEIGGVFQNAEDADALQAQAGAVQESVSEFEGAIDSMSGYTLDDPQLEEQREGFVAAGQSLVPPLNDLADAVAAADVAAVAEVLPDLQAAAEEFQAVTAQTP